MNTSGVADPREISVTSPTWFVSVFVGAGTSVTWMSGYCFSNVLISTVRASVVPDPAIGLAAQVMVPEAGPVASGSAGEPPLLVPLLVHPVTARADNTRSEEHTSELQSHSFISH